jgi:hypothetical protein
MYHKYRTVILVLSILLLVYALHLLPTSSIHNVSALLTDPHVEVFRDRNCTQRVSSIDWGSLAPGETKTVSVYVQSKSNETCILILIPTGWNPPAGANYLELNRDYENKKIQPSEIVRVTLSLTVSPNVAGITNFNFNIIVEGSKYLLGDLNKDGSVDIFDAVVISAALNSTIGTPTWNPDADLNKDGRVDLYDIVLLSQNWGKKW